MRIRPILSMLALSFIGGAVISLNLWWVSPCVGAFRFVDCIELFSGQEIIDYGLPVCHMQNCETFFSAFETLSRILFMLAIIVGTGALGAFFVFVRAVFRSDNKIL